MYLKNQYPHLSEERQACLLFVIEVLSSQLIKDPIELSLGEGPAWDPLSCVVSLYGQCKILLNDAVIQDWSSRLACLEHRSCSTSPMVVVHVMT